VGSGSLTDLFLGKFFQYLIIFRLYIFVMTSICTVRCIYLDVKYISRVFIK